MRRAFAFFLFIPIVLSAACSTVLQVEPGDAYAPEPAALQVESPERAWWRLRYKLAWPEDEDPDFSRHLLIAEQVLLPVIVDYQDHMHLWRFHRRAARTPSGHQFSLLIYTDAASASAIEREIRANPVATWLEDSGMIERVRFDRLSEDDLVRLEDTSDRKWPIEIQRSWPYFIMGVSQAWLMQVQELSTAQPLAGTVDYDELLAHYQRVDEQLNTQWSENGQHAYLHHLSAVYGYQPMVVRSTILRTF